MLNTNDIVKYPDDEFQAGIYLIGYKNRRNQSHWRRSESLRLNVDLTMLLIQNASQVLPLKPILAYGPAIEYLKWGNLSSIRGYTISIF